MSYVDIMNASERDTRRMCAIELIGPRIEHACNELIIMLECQSELSGTAEMVIKDAKAALKRFEKLKAKWSEGEASP